MQHIIPILYEDTHCIAFAKPTNVVVHHSHYARNLNESSLLELLRDAGHTSVYPIHRLDRKTSGVLLFAKDKDFVKHFQSLFDQQSIQKKYTALLRGHVVGAGVIDSPVKNERGNYKEACTHFRCLQHFTLSIPVQPYPESRYSLVEFEPKTGRMHQLRIHANKISHPIIGDPKYGNRHHNHSFADRLSTSELFLHASSLQFTHPFSGEKIQISAPLPSFWERFFTCDAHIHPVAKES